MSNTNTGGPAFPRSGDFNSQTGMTLRDYFAAKAMQAGISGCASRGEAFVYGDMSKFAYDVADAMLKARDA